MAEKTVKKNRGLLIGLLILILVIFCIVVMSINSRKPEPLAAIKYDAKVKGAAFVRTNQMLIQQMMGNWLPNDMYWPTVFLDNMPNFQIGELEVVRYNIHVLRDNLSRMRTTDKIDRKVEDTFTALSNDPYKWWFPSAESKWQDAYNDLEVYYQNLVTGVSNFYPRGDNLIELVDDYASLMGGVNTRLINAPQRSGTVLPVDAGDKENRGKNSQLVSVNISWHHIDDNFYYAQGVAYGIYESFKAIKIDFRRVLEEKGAMVLVNKILENLERCYFEPWIVFNGSSQSIFANHSLNLSSVFNDARQKIDSLSTALRQG
ncbi:MAG: hypothetical protein B6240_09375 [Desulfobacteraceae bacterium 4572_87]|nr:MAG: hypothetical protein B6240_09375 [Desulfobacteraceae bacterium 4572_87]